MTKPFTIETYQSMGNKPLTREDCIKHKIHYRNGEVPDLIYYKAGSSWWLRSVHSDGYVINNTSSRGKDIYDLLIDVEDEIVMTEREMIKEIQENAKKINKLFQEIADMKRKMPFSI